MPAPLHGNGRYFQEEDFEQGLIVRFRMTWWSGSIIFIATVMAFLAAAHSGAWWQRVLDRQAAEHAIAEFPGCRACPATFPQTPWRCTPEETRDRADACRGRALLERAERLRTPPPKG